MTKPPPYQLPRMSDTIARLILAKIPTDHVATAVVMVRIHNQLTLAEHDTLARIHSSIAAHEATVTAWEDAQQWP